jgi:hypothetical protein
VIRAVPRRAPSSRFGRSATCGATTWATGSPKRVTRTGFPVLRTFSRTARQVALNFEMAISSTNQSVPWSKTMVNVESLMFLRLIDLGTHKVLNRRGRGAMPRSALIRSADNISRAPARARTAAPLHDPAQNLQLLGAAGALIPIIYSVREMASALRLVAGGGYGQDALMRRWRLGGRATVILALTLALALAWLSGCSRQIAVPGSGGNAVSRDLPFDRVSDHSGISPTAGFTSDGVPAGTEIIVRLQSGMSSAEARAGDSFQAVVDEPVVVAGRTVVPRGTAVAGSVLAVQAARGSYDRGYLRVTLASIDMDGKPVALQTSSIFAKGGWYEKRKTAAMKNPPADAGVDHGQGDIRFSTGHRFTFRLTQPLHLVG